MPYLTDTHEAHGVAYHIGGSVASSALLRTATYDRKAFFRADLLPLDDTDDARVFFIAAPEDTILNKLRWFRLESILRTSHEAFRASPIPFLVPRISRSLGPIPGLGIGIEGGTGITGESKSNLLDAGCSRERQGRS